MERKKINWSNILIVLAVLSLICWLCSNQIKENHLQSDPMLAKLKEILNPLHTEVKKLRLYRGKKSYTINKERIYLCLYDKNGDYYPINLLVYVLIHEFSHYLNKDDVGHTPAFHKKFEELLDKASDIGIYNPSIPIDATYCTHT